MSLLIVVAFIRFYSYQADFSCAERLDINLKQLLMAIFCIMHIKAVKRRQNPVGICGEPCIYFCKIHTHEASLSGDYSDVFWRLQ